MPVVLAPIIAGAFVSIGIGAATAGILGQVVVIAVGIGLSLLSSVLFRPSQPQPKPSDVQTIIRQATGARRRSYGRVKVGGTLMFANTKAGFYGRVIAMGSGEIDGVEQHWIDDVQVTLAGNVVTTPKYNYQFVPRAHIEFRLGTDAPAPYDNLVAQFPGLWTVNHLGKGIPSAYIVLQQVKQEAMPDMFPQYGNTGYRQVQRGAKIRGVAAGILTAPAYSDNAARVILDYLTHPDGLKLDSSWIQNAIADWEIAVNNCDALLPVPGGGTEARYRIWNTYSFDERPADVLARFLQACDAVIYPTPDRGIGIKVGVWEAPTVTIDDDAILGFTEFGRGRDILATANTVTARYTSEPHDFLEADADPLADDADVAERGELATDLSLFAVPSHSQARRLMQITLFRANPAWVGRLSCNLRALPVMGERFVNVVISELGISETFEVLNVQLMIEGTICRGVEVQIASLSAAAYAWDGSDTGIPPVVEPPIVSDNTIPEPTGATVSMLNVIGVEVRVSWDESPDDFLQGEVRYRPVAAAEWLAQPVADDATMTVVFNIVPATLYEFEVRHRSLTTQRVSPWISAGTITSAQIDLNFASDEYFQLDGSSDLASLVTVSRASIGYAEDSLGLWLSFAANAARRTDKGLLVEETRTNGLRNNAMVGAVAGTPGTRPTFWPAITLAGTVQTIATPGAVNGIDVIDIRFAGTANATTIQISFEDVGQIAAALGQIWTGSVWLALVGGTTANITNWQLRVQELDAGGTNLALGNIAVPTPGATLTRCQGSRTLTQATTAFTRLHLAITITNGAAIDFTIRIGWPQLELGEYASSPIRTSTMAVTRAADVINLTSPPSFSAAYTIFGAGIPDSSITDATGQAIVEVGSGTAANQWSAGRATGIAAVTLTAGGSVTLSGGAWNQHASGSIAAAYAVNDQAYSFDGGAAVTGASALSPSGIDTVWIGSAGAGTDQWNGYIERVIVWPNLRLANAELQRLTAP